MHQENLNRCVQCNLALSNLAYIVYQEELIRTSTEAAPVVAAAPVVEAGQEPLYSAAAAPVRSAHAALDHAAHGPAPPAAKKLKKTSTSNLASARRVKASRRGSKRKGIDGKDQKKKVNDSRFNTK